IAKECVALGAEWIGVSSVGEAVLLREYQIKRPILVVTPAQKESYADAIRNKLSLTVSSVVEAQALGRAAVKLRREARVQLQIDTGMGWLGCWHEEAPGIIEKIRRLPGVKLE